MDQNKSHGHDGIFIRMIKLCDKALFGIPFPIIQQLYRHNIFPKKWKKSNVCPIHDIGEKKKLKTTEQFHYSQSLVKYI